MASDSSSVVTSANESKKHVKKIVIFHTSVANTTDYKTFFANKLGLIHKANFRFRLL